jgi:hypothetical protein
MVTGADSEHAFAGFPVHLNAAAVHYETPQRSAGKDEVRIQEGVAPPMHDRVAAAAKVVLVRSLPESDPAATKRPAKTCG